jgi:hypothetical protein
VDYAFAPGGSGYDNDMHRLLARRAGTTLVTPKQTGQPTIAAFLKYLATTASVTKPVGDLVIASHGDDAGWMKIGLDNPAKTSADYEEVQRVDTAGTIQVPSALIDTASGMTIHIRGCRIGQAGPFMTLLKHAFGGTAKVTAPLFFHLLRTETAEGSFEYLGYSFGFPSTDDLTTKDAVVDAFTKLTPKLKFYDGTDVPDTRWPDWIPPTTAEAHYPKPIYADLGQKIGSLGKKLKVRLEFRHDVEPTGFDFKNIASDPGSQQANLQKLKTLLPTDPRYKSTHPYPVYVRLGYTSGDLFVDGYNWQFAYDAKAQILTCSGTRHFYTAIVPVTDVTTGQLLYNFYPNSGSSVAAVTKLPDTDGHFFLTV